MVEGRNIEPGNDRWTIRGVNGGWCKAVTSTEDLINFSPMRRRSLRLSLRTPFSLRPVICLLESYKIGQVQPPKGPLPPFLFFHTPPAQTDVYCFCSVKRPQLSCVCMRWWGAWLRYIQYVSGIKAWVGKRKLNSYCLLPSVWVRVSVTSNCLIITWIYSISVLLIMHLGAAN